MSNPYLGEIRPFAGSFAPRNWLQCNGSLLSIAEYDALYSLIGTAFGGDGITTFGLPDLRGRLPVGVGQGPGLTNRVLGQMSGSESVTLTSLQMPAHNHAVVVSGDAAESPQPANQVPAAPANGGVFYLPPGIGTQVDAPMAGDCLTIAGGGQPHENRMPATAITYIIATSGVYPQRN
jgi:microcystin-dependent protein